jgi:hypothetical protein
MVVLMLTVMLLLAIYTGCGVKEGQVTGVTTLRSEYKTLDKDAAKSALKQYGFFDRRWNKYSSFPNKFEAKEVGGDKIVIDHATNLVWHQSGSPTQMNHQEAQNWLKNFNKKGYAGYHTWRFPTLEEAASLVESKREKKRHIAPIFSVEHYSTHTGDILNEFRYWGVSYHYGGLFRVGIIDTSYIKPVTKYK